MCWEITLRQEGISGSNIWRGQSRVATTIVPWRLFWRPERGGVTLLKLLASSKSKSKSNYQHGQSNIRWACRIHILGPNLQIQIRIQMGLVLVLRSQLYRTSSNVCLWSALMCIHILRPKLKPLLQALSLLERMEQANSVVGKSDIFCL